jgi:hypothetical protein
MLEQVSWHTRLATRVSPEEMTDDPRFVLSELRAEVPREVNVGYQTDCDEDRVGRLTLPDGTILGVPEPEWLAAHGYDRVQELYAPLFSLAALRVERTGAVGPPVVIADHGPAIRAAVDAINAEIGVDAVLHPTRRVVRCGQVDGVGGLAWAPLALAWRRRRAARR